MLLHVCFFLQMLFHMCTVFYFVIVRSIAYFNGVFSFVTSSFCKLWLERRNSWNSHYFFSSVTINYLWRYIIFFISTLLFFLSVMLWFVFDPMLITFQSLYNLKLFGFYISMGYDGLSLLFIFLTCFIMPLCILFNWYNNRVYVLEYVVFLFCVELLLLFVFSVSNVLFFFIFFELILVPFFILIGLYGSRDRKVHASYMLVFYTLFGSVFMLLSILFFYIHVGSTNYYLLYCAELSDYRDFVLWFTFFLSFGIKVPMYPFHIWLPEAHVESPTEGSVVLAAVILKIGGYGFFRILLPIFPHCTLYFSSFVFLICILSIIFTSFTTLRQTDIKRVIAYSSIAHMNVAMLGFIGLNLFSLLGSILLMLGHGFVSGGLFFLIGILYDRFKTKGIKYYSGLMYLMPIFSSFFFFFVLGNISLPMTCNFIGEFLVLFGLLHSLNYLGVFAVCLSIYFCTCYTVLLYNRMAFGLPHRIIYSTDVTSLEFAVLSPLLFFIIFIGVFPGPFIDVIYYNILCLLLLTI